MKNLPAEILSADEKSEFAKLDATIKTGAKTFMEVGRALVGMHEGRLYRAEFPNFKEYAESRGISRRRAYELMEAVQVTLEIEDVRTSAHDVDTGYIEAFEKSSANIRSALAKVQKAIRAKVFKLAFEKTKGKPTAKDIEEIAAEMGHKPKPRRQKSKPSPDPVKQNAPEHAEVKSDEPPAGFGGDEISRALKPRGAISPEEFQFQLDALEKLIPSECDHTKYGVIANKFVQRQMNFKKEKTSFAYGR